MSRWLEWRAMVRERISIVTMLLVVAAAAWCALVRASSAQMEMSMGPTMGMAALPFIGLWVVMMVAMMFPAAAPMVVMFAHVHSRKRASARPAAPTWVFIGGYIAVWASLGVPVYAAAAAAQHVAAQSSWTSAHAGLASAALFVAAGMYQLSPLKHRCLSHCRSPLAFIATSWREGYRGAFLMGLQHGAYCTGCCWLLFLLLLPLGMMNIAAMAAMTVFVVAEKMLPGGRAFVTVSGLALIGCGIALTLRPGLF